MSEQTVNLKHMLDRANDALAAGDLPSQGDMGVMGKEYGDAINDGACPCGGGRSYADCCKQIWQATERGVKNFDRNAKKQAKQEKKMKKEQKRATKNDRWFCRLGIDEKGQFLVDTVGLEAEKNKMPDFALAGLILSCYHQLMVEDRVMMINGACNKLGGDIMKRLAGAGGPTSKIKP